jgi:MHS family proline/betaine transporter-like MFS transporter
MQENKLNLSAIFLLGIGTLLEWAEYTIYGYSALIIAKNFFPFNNEVLSILNTFTVFAVGYLFRPFGALFFGYIGDTYGRKPALMGALILMGIATLGMGLLPTYAKIGMVAPVLLCILRLLQGMAVSGEFNGAAIYLIENSPQKNKSLMGAWISANAGLGMVIGGIGALLVLNPKAPDWAWRIPFLIGGISAIIALYMRKNISESHNFRSNIKEKENNKEPMLSLLLNYKKNILFVGLTAAFTGVFIYINNIYIVVYLSQYLDIGTSTAMKFAILGESLSVLLILFFGWAADKTSSRYYFYLGMALCIPLAPCIYWLLDTKEPFFILVAMIIFATINGLTSGPLMKCLYDQFPTIGKYTGISFSWGVFVAVFGGTAPIVAHTMLHNYNLNPGFYVSMFSLICVVFLPMLDSKSKNIEVPNKYWLTH